MIPARTSLTTLFLPAGIDRSAWVLLAALGPRGLCDGFIAVLLPACLPTPGFAKLTVGLVVTSGQTEDPHE